ncbi:MAG: hypothetical protein H6737_09330 [Alphaproteobacteria bacterium]|nr:hypothetical protein [Alphaproteobacteria bacterium]
MLALLSVLSAAQAATDHDVPRTTVSVSAASWGYREGLGTRFELARGASITTSLDPFRFGVGFVSNTGFELHPVSLYLGGHGWIVPTVGIGAFATGGIPRVHADPITSAGLYAAPGLRWTGPKGRSSTMLGVTGRYTLQGEQALDDIALTFGIEYALGRPRRGRPELPAADDLPEG